MIFQPHRFSRTKMLFKDFILTLSKVDKVFLLPIYSASEKEIKGATSKNMAKKLNKINGKNFCNLVNHENVNDMVEQYIDKYDVVITQGAGNVSMVSKGLIERWKT
jgi:UDP-N-acetylmuramate--alanine ligase